ncbi:MAG: ADP-ribosylglycohydrolase family protein [Acidobacteria bacterium]|nr:ADP-ribosylglycohydrolase family protein [Acidobacteriota bacterium]MCB9396838.1 ADP-ribosylglycohydrolase family protein [Acidobacteriota bacterium]
MDLRERIAGGLYGLLIGDALGVPYEFHEPSEIPKEAEIEFNPPTGFVRAHAHIQAGTWSDDGAQALCLLSSLLECKGLDLHNLGEKFLAWYDRGYMAVDAHVFDIGITTRTALAAIRSGVPAEQAGPRGLQDNGNGSLMRVLPLALWHRGPDEELVDLAQRQSTVTHGHIRSQVCCALYCLWARCIMQDKRNPWEGAVSSLRQIYAKQPDYLEELETAIQPDNPPPGKGTGYVVDCLFSALAVQNHNRFEKVVKQAILLGRDTDTTACVAGGIAGLRFGISAIPQKWRNALRGQELVEPLLIELLLKLCR